MLELCNCLSKQECKDVLKTVHVLKDHWIERMGKDFLFTLLEQQAISTLQATKKLPITYKIQPKKTNPLLLEHFPLLYQKKPAVAITG